MSWEVGWSEVGYKSVLILGEMVYVKQMHEDSFSLLTASAPRRREGGRQRFPRCFGLFTPLT